MTACPVCRGEHFEMVLQHRGRVMASDRQTSDGALEKEMCRRCGALRTVLYPGLDFYRQDYQQNSVPHKFSYVTAAGIVPRSAVEWEAFETLRRPQPGETWLEVGCGAGDLLSHLTERHPETQAFGIELSEAAARTAQNRGFKVRQGTIAAADMRYDVIFAFGVLEHLEDPLLFLREAEARLKPGGSVLLSLPDVQTLTFDPWFVDHLHHLSVQHVMHLCRQAGLGTWREGQRPAPTPHFMFVRADRGSDGEGDPMYGPLPDCIVQWREGLEAVREGLSRARRPGFIGASETAVFLLTYAPGERQPVLFDDQCIEPAERYGCQLLPGAELLREPGRVDVAIVATVPAYYAAIERRFGGAGVPLFYPLRRK